MLKPIFTEKSLKMAKQGQYSFWVDKNANKKVLKSQISKLFGVHVEKIKTTRSKAETKRNAKGVKFTKMGQKKAIVALKGNEKIDLFEEKK